MKALLALTLLLASTASVADDGPAIVMMVYNGKQTPCREIEIPSADFSLLPVVGVRGRCLFRLNDQVSKFSTCTGDAANEHCGLDDYTGVIVKGAAAGEWGLPWGTTPQAAPGPGPTSSACNPGATFAKQGIGLNSDNICMCFQKTCSADANCGTGGSCNNSRCTLGSTSTLWKCAGVS